MTVTLSRAGGGSAKLSFEAARLLMPETARKAVESAALVTKRTILDGSPARLRGVGTRGARLGVRYDVKGEQNPVAIVKAVGPWQLIENNTRAHDIKPKRRRSPKKAILTPQGPRRSAHHPGTRGQHPFAKGVERATPAATLAFVKTVRADLVKQFG